MQPKVLKGRILPVDSFMHNGDFKVQANQATSIINHAGSTGGV